MYCSICLGPLGGSVFWLEGGFRLDVTESVPIQGKRLLDTSRIVEGNGTSVEYVVAHFGALDFVDKKIRCIRFFGLIQFIPR